MFVDCMCQCPPLVSNLSMYYDTEMSTHGAISPPTDRAPSLAACIVAGLSASVEHSSWSPASTVEFPQLHALEKFEPEHGEEDTALHHHFCYSIGYSCVPSRKRRNPTSLSICSTTESQFLSLPPLGDGLVLHLGLTLIWPAHVTLGDVGSAISELMLLLLVLKRGLTWPRVPDLAWWRFPASAVREGLHIGFGINVRCARDGKQTRRSVGAPPFLPPLPPTLRFISLSLPLYHVAGTYIVTGKPREMGVGGWLKKRCNHERGNALEGMEESGPHHQCSCEFHNKWNSRNTSKDMIHDFIMYNGLLACHVH
ncbi:hypothetical protein MUK42_25148 [Musa troglodytarum]|uniref:Uncharacterized protein n=1 Tax=Musa troglodytarum TaxID=320322 RepID=A0A9E7LF62_9LILI|nr:hypothetical protein MUK42_25148 [Musa troglodytarum]